MSKIKITYHVADGYVGGSRPQYMTIDSEDFEGLTRKEAEEQIDEEIDEHFRMNIHAEADDMESVLDQLKLSK